MEEKINIPYKSIFETTNVIMAATVQGDLKRAGFDVILNDAGDGEFHVVVASEDYENAKSLLITNPKYGQIFTGPKE